MRWLLGIVIVCASACGSSAPRVTVPVGAEVARAAPKPQAMSKNRAQCTSAGECRTACKAGAPSACTRQGEFEEKAEFLSRAAAAYEQACHDFDALGCARLASLYDRVQSFKKTWKDIVALNAPACEGGVGMACEALGWAYHGGRGVPQPDHARGSALIVRAAALYAADCDAGSAEDCALLGELLYAGVDVEKDEARATALFVKACDAGNAIGCQDLAAHGIASGQQLDKACELTADACNEVGLRYEFGRSVAEDPVHSAALYKEACDRDDGRGCANLGYMTEHGLGVTQDLDVAASLYQQACQHGDRTGCFDLGRMYLDGRGMHQSDANALAAFDQSCGDEFEGPACRMLGQMYLQGRGTQKDASRASRLYDKACQGGDQAACLDLAALYEAGTGMKQNPAAAIKLYDQACGNGNGAACGHLGEIYDIGDLVPKNDAQADDHYAKGCNLADDLSCRKQRERDPLGAPDGLRPVGQKAKAAAKKK